MLDFLTSQITINLFLQQLPDWFISLMQSITFLGEEIFYLLFMPLFYWCISQSAGIRIGLMLLMSNSMVYASKMILQWPRPYWLDNTVIGYVNESTFGVPSGHSANAASVWGILGYILRRRIATLLVVVLAFLIGFSRMVLGAHFLVDVLAGWLLGFLLLLVFIRIEKPVISWFKRLNTRQQVIIALVSSLLLMMPAMLLSWTLKDWQLPHLWVQNAGHPIHPLSIESVFTVGGTWGGFLTGFALLGLHYSKMGINGTIIQKIIRYLVGITGVMILWAGLDLAFPDTADPVGLMFRYLRYFLIGFWISGLAPVVFRKLNLINAH